jgi:hypothetical protein
MVSIIVTMVLIMIMTLVVISMSENANREQRQSIDRQLSDQAFYNAESGINDWANYLYQNPTAVAQKSTCEPQAPPAAGFTENIDTDGSNKYSCVFYDKSPRSIEFDNLSISDSSVIALQPDNNINQLIFKWRPADGDGRVDGCNFNGTTFARQLPANCEVGGLRIDLVDSAGTRSQVAANSFAAYALPRASGAGVMTFGTGQKGAVGVANCSNGECTLRLNSPGILSGARKFLHIKSLYADNDVTITGCRNSSATNCDLTSGNGNQLVRFNNAQIELDVTGKSLDVLRRIKVRVPAQSQYDNAGSFSLKTTQSICKLITVSDTDRTATPDTARCPD